MKRYLIIILSLIALVGCKDNSITHADIQEPEIQNEDVFEPETNQKNENEELLKQIEVSNDEATILNDKQIITVWVENKSDKIFTGDIHITFRNDKSKIIGSDMIIVEDLKPGNKTYAKVSADLSNSINISYNFAREYSFIDDNIGKDGIYDEVLSEVLRQYMYESFGGSGKKEFAASWYEYISKLEIYKSDDVFYSIITINTDDNTYIKQIANTVLVNFKDVELIKIIVKNTDGDIVFEKSK